MTMTMTEKQDTCPLLYKTYRYQTNIPLAWNIFFKLFLGCSSTVVFLFKQGVGNIKYLV